MRRAHGVLKRIMYMHDSTDKGGAHINDYRFASPWVSRPHPATMRMIRRPPQSLPPPSPPYVAHVVSNAFHSPQLLDLMYA